MIKAIVFSNNSPKALDVFLQSAKDKDIKCFEFSVLYKSDDINSAEYLSIFEKHDIVSFENGTDFKSCLIHFLNQGENKLISFFKDTNYFFSEMPDTNIEDIMSDQDIFCFSMALGKNTMHCYHNDVYNILLNEEENSDNTIKWNWVKHYLDFGRPLELGAGHTFHKKEIAKLFKKWNYESIQELEESFDKLDYYPKELMSSFKRSILADVVLKEESKIEDIKEFDFSNIDRTIIEI